MHAIWNLAGALLVGVALGALVLAGRHSGLLRDAGAPHGGRPRPYSLGRTQMAFWFALIFVSYVWLWAGGDDLPTIPQSLLGLVGLSGSAALAAAAVDKGHGRTPPPSAGFWLDLVTDAHGITLARLQAVAWTLLFGVVFASRVASQHAMPDFDTTTLALLGASVGTYVGFKVPETHTPGDTAVAADDDPKAGYEPLP